MKYSTTYNLFLLKMLTAAIFMLSATEVLSQNIIPFDSLGILKYPGYIFDYTQKKIESTNKVIYKHLDEKDTHYITPNLYKWTFMAQYSNCYEYYKFSAKTSSQSSSLSPDTRN